MTNNPFNIQSHINNINESIQELRQFHERTVSPSPIPHQYVGTIIDSTIGLLCSAGNSLDNGNRNITFSDPARNWVSLMGIIHRIFFSMLHISFELGITKVCERLKLETISSESKTFLDILNKINTEDTIELEKLKKHFKKKKPSFQDRLNTILNRSKLAKDRKNTWRNFFKAITILRNKVSHSDTSLSQEERDLLKNGGLGVVVSAAGELQLNARLYAQAGKYVLDFWDELFNSFESDISRELKEWSNDVQ